MSEAVASNSAGPLRRLGAMFYDTLLIVAILIVSTFLFVPLAGGKVLVPNEVGFLAYFYWTFELAVVFLYLGFFWRSKQRTLGMQAWRLMIERSEGGAITWRDVTARFASAFIPWLPAFLVMTIAEHQNSPSLRYVGIGLLSLGLVNYLAGYWTTQRRPWHERWLRTRIVVRT